MKKSIRSPAYKNEVILFLKRGK